MSLQDLALVLKELKPPDGKSLESSEERKQRLEQEALEAESIAVLDLVRTE